MKKVVLVLSLLTLNSCGSREPIIGGKKPFVVESIVKYNETHSEYIAKDMESGKWNDNLESAPAIVLPSGMYNIGDTIQIFKKK